MAKGFFGKAGHFLFKRHLVVTNTVTSGLLMAAGDSSTQYLERWAGQGHKGHDWARTGRLFCLGTMLGPLNHVWYSFLDAKLKGKTLKIVGQKIMCDQTFAAPTFMFTFFMGVGTMEGQPLRTSFAEFRNKFWEVYLADWMFWPAAQSVNFLLLPPRFRVVYVASITCIWNSFLSYMKHRDQRKQLLLLETAEVERKGDDSANMAANKMAADRDNMSASTDHLGSNKMATSRNNMADSRDSSAKLGVHLVSCEVSDSKSGD